MTKYTFTVLALLVATAAQAPAQTPATTKAQSVALVVREDSRLWIEGTSNLHEWSCKATKLDATISVDPSWETEVATSVTNIATLVKRVDVQIPVLSLKCGKDKMDKLMYDALKAKEAESVSYIGGSFEASPGETKD